MKPLIWIPLATLLLLITAPGCTRSSGGDDPYVPAWTHPASLADNISPNHADADDPEVAMNDNGHIIIVWEQSDGTNDQIFKSEFRSGAWSHRHQGERRDGEDVHDCRPSCSACG